MERIQCAGAGFSTNILAKQTDVQITGDVGTFGAKAASGNIGQSNDPLFFPHTFLLPRSSECTASLIVFCAIETVCPERS